MKACQGSVSGWVPQCALIEAKETDWKEELMIGKVV